MTNPKLEEIAQRQMGPDLPRTKIIRSSRYTKVAHDKLISPIVILNSDYNALKAVLMATGKSVEEYLSEYIIFVQEARVVALDIKESKLDRIPEEIGELTELQKITLNTNHLTCLPKSITQLKKLERLYLYSNRIASLPEDIGKLSCLHDLSVGDNKLKTLPESIVELTLLNTLYLTGNKIEVLPENIGWLSSLYFLNLLDNRITSLPESIVQLQELGILDLRRNPIEKLPEFLADMPKLETIYVNSMVKVPNSVLDKVSKHY